jgi:hypothetical protein
MLALSCEASEFIPILQSRDWCRLGLSCEASELSHVVLVSEITGP